MSCYKFYVGSNDNSVVIEGLLNPETNEPVNDATVEVTLYESDGKTELDGVVWPLTLDFVLGSSGDYSGSFDASVLTDVVDGTTGKMKITAVSGALDATWWADYVFETRTAIEYLTSRKELENMFGVRNIEVWADLENEQDEAVILERIQWAIEEATAEARGAIIAGPQFNACLNDRRLRQAVTRLAGVQLYESRGITDTADEEGRHRLKWHRDRAEKYFQRVAAGQIRIGGGGTPTAYPSVVTDYDD